MRVRGSWTSWATAIAVVGTAAGPSAHQAAAASTATQIPVQRQLSSSPLDSLSTQSVDPSATPDTGQTRFGGPVGQAGRPNTATAGQAPSTGLLQGHYAAPIRTSAGDIDVNATLNGVIARGSRLYQYLLYPRAGFDSARDWARLPLFLSAAQRRGVSVQVVLTPPASTSGPGRPCSANLLLPYAGRYDEWMRQIGTLASRHRNLSGVVMDDYAYSSTNRPAAECRSFKPGTITRWNAILRHYAGRNITVIPILYLADVLGPNATYASIKREAGTVVWPFVSIGTPYMRAQYSAMKRAYPGMKIYVMVYAYPFKGRTPTRATVAREVGTARTLKPQGVILYSQKLS